MSPQAYKENGYKYDLNLLSSRTICMFHIIQEVSTMWKCPFKAHFLLD